MDIKEDNLDEVYNLEKFDINNIQKSLNGSITEKDRLNTAKQILLGLAILYILTIIAYLFKPQEGVKLIDICTTIFPSLATMILVFYFRQGNN
jgi:hypothetical protein